METSNLTLIAEAKGLSQSELARRAKLSRQAVSLWLAKGEGFVEVKSSHLKRLALGLGVSADDLLMPLPAFGEAERQEMRARYLWDRLYPSLNAFLVALSRGEERAIARLVDREGMYAAARIAGSVVWSAFPQYKRHLPAARRRDLERLWSLRHPHGLT